MSPGEVVFYDFDNFRLDPQRQQLLKNGEPVLLTHKAFETLHILVQNFGQIVEKEYIYTELWADSFVEEANLTQYIYLLRKTLDKNTEGVSYIETVARRGYIFNAQVEKVFAAEPIPNALLQPPSSEDKQHIIAAVTALKYSAPEESRPNYRPLRLVREEKDETLIHETNGHSTFPDELPEKSKHWNWSSRLLTVEILLTLVSAISVGLLIYFQLDKTESRTVPGISSLAVLPFQQIGVESNEAKLGFGMADAIITRLSKLQQIPVRPSSAIFRYVEQPASNLPETGRDLGVDAILEGTVQRDGERVRVSIQLISVAEGNVLWAEMFDEKSSDIFAIQDSIASRVANSVVSELTPQELKLVKKWPTNNTEAFEAFQLGVYFWNTRTKDNLQKAQVHFQKAVDIDPNFARAHAMLADTYNLLGYYRYADRDEMYEKARIAAEHSLKLDDSVAEAHIAMAFARRDSEAQYHLERSIELAPYNSTARVRYAWLLIRSGKSEQAIGQIRLAKEYDPLSPISNGGLCNMLSFQEDFDGAVKACEKAVELAPDATESRLALANAYFFAGRSKDAISQAKIAAEANGNKFSALGSLAYFYAKLGSSGEAETIVAQLIKESEKDAGLLNDLTLITYALGRKDEAFTYYQKAYNKKALTIFMVRNDRPWKEIRNDTRFAELIAEKQ